MYTIRKTKRGRLVVEANGYSEYRKAYISGSLTFKVSMPMMPEKNEEEIYFIASSIAQAYYDRFLHRRRNLNKYDYQMLLETFGPGFRVLDIGIVQ